MATAKYMATSPLFIHGRHIEASYDSPFFFGLDESEVPSAQWYPLDEAALKALQALAEKVKKEVGNIIPIHAIPDDVVVPARVQIIRPLPPQEKYVQPQEATAFSEIQRNDATAPPRGADGKPLTRPSDQEPGKRK